ncbi:MAG: WxcM-like domain-containing protein [Ignavibacterium sp.]
MVLSSTHYSEADYIYDYKAYLQFLSNEKA